MSEKPGQKKYLFFVTIQSLQNKKSYTKTGLSDNKKEKRMTGYIKIPRDVINFLMSRDSVYMHVWIHLSARARYTKTIQDDIELQPGQLLASAPEIAGWCKLSVRQVRYILEKLEEMQFLTYENIRNRHMLITIKTPEDLQNNSQTNPPKVTAEERQDTLPQSESEPKTSYGMFKNVLLTEEENRQLHQRCAVAESYVDRLSAYKRRTDKEYKDDFAVLCEWIAKDETAAPAKQTNNATSAKPNNNAPSREQQTTATLDTRTPVSYDFMTSPASYDLELAERIARTSVPKLRKRPPR